MKKNKSKNIFLKLDSTLANLKKGLKTGAPSKKKMVPETGVEQKQEDLFFDNPLVSIAPSQLAEGLTVSPPMTQELVLIPYEAGNQKNEVIESETSDKIPVQIQSSIENQEALLDVAVQLVDLEDKNSGSSSLEEWLNQEIDQLGLDENDEEDIEAVDELQESEFTESVILEFEELLPKIKDSFEGLMAGKKDEIEKFHRFVHTWKSNSAAIGAQKTRILLDKLENEAEGIKNGEIQGDQNLFEKLGARLSQAENQMKALLDARHQKILESKDSEDTKNGTSRGAELASTAKKIVRISLETIDGLFSEMNESRLTTISLKNTNASLRQKLKDLDETMVRLSRLARDIEIQVETQIQSRRVQLAEFNKDFDPLELDRFTVAQERGRLLAETVSDLQDTKRDIMRVLSEQESDLVYLERGVNEVQDGLQKSRLLSVDSTINARLHRVVLGDSKILGKQVALNLTGGKAMLDRSVLEKVVVPLEHLLRNALAHGIEMPNERQKVGKDPMGQIHVVVSQEAGRILFVVEDDGAGLNVDKIRQKAIDKGLWEKDKPMSDANAADIICMPNFSTLDVANIIAGKGVGMDVVRHDVLAMGGRFDLISRPGRGLRVVIQLPTTISTTSVLVVEAGLENYSIPVEIVENVILLKGKELEEVRLNRLLAWEGESIPFANLSKLLKRPDSKRASKNSSSVLILKEGGRKVAVEVNAVQQVVESPLRSLNKLWSSVKGVIGATILPDGSASFLVDPLRVSWSSDSSSEEEAQVTQQINVMEKQLIMVVDDSITVRKHTTLFLQRLNYEVITAKDGIDALDKLNQSVPSLILLDVEMPRMDGFDFAKNVRSNPASAHIPIIMITSRIAEKHRERALDLGVNEYIGKPFNEKELEALIDKYIV